METIRPRTSVIVFCLILAFIIGISLLNLTIIPRIFFDEGITIEVARNFQLFGVPDILTAPGQFSGFPYINGSSGFPITLPLAMFFKIFGFSFAQARVYALAWLLISLITAWIFVKNFWNTSYATGALALIVGFASLYDSGRRVMGDVPGFALLLVGLFLLLKKERPYLAGVFFGLAVAAKPSVYLLVIPALILTYLIADWRRAFRKLLPIGVGATAPILLWVLLQFPEPLHLRTWQGAIAFYRNAFGSSYSPWASILRNIKSFGSQTTLIYFSILVVPTMLAFRKKLAAKDPLTLFIILYGIMDFCYFMKSPGIIRYLLPLQFFILLMLPATAAWIVQKLEPRVVGFIRVPAPYMWLVMITGISGLHIVQLLFFSSVVAKNTAHLQTLEFLSRYTTETIGVISSPHIAAFLPPERKLHYLRETDQIIFGTNPLDLPREKLPSVLVIPAGYEESVPFSDAELEHLKRYALVMDGRWKIYHQR